jgi:hypothetical protein
MTETTVDTPAPAPGARMAAMARAAVEVIDALDDVTLIVMSLTTIALVSIFNLESPGNVVDSIVSGMLGMAIGRKTAGGPK